MNARILALTGVLCGMALSAAVPFNSALSDGPTVRWQYVSSLETPDGLAFVDWLQYFSEELSRSRADSAKYLVFQFDLPENAESLASVESAIDVLQQASIAFSNDVLASEIASYCPSGEEVRSNDQIFEVMDAQDDEYVRIAEWTYANVGVQLAPAVRETLQTAVARHKRSFHAISTSHKDQWESTNQNPDMRAILGGICAELIAKRDQRDY